MELNINLRYVVIFLLIIIPILIIILEIINKKIKKKLNEKTRNKIYLEYLSLTYHIDPEKELEKIDKIARSFFLEAFSVEKLSNYTELEDYFKRFNKSKEAEFCNLMNNLMYAPVNKTKEKNLQLKKLLREIIIENRILKNKLKK